VIRAGLFVQLDETGADGIIPVSSLPNDFYDHDEKRHALVGRRWGQVYRLGDRVQVRLVTATPLTGGLTFELIEGGGEDAPQLPQRGKGRPKPAPARKKSALPPRGRRRRR